MSIRLTIDKAGRVAIPKALREELNLGIVGGNIYEAMLAHCAVKPKPRRYDIGTRLANLIG